MKVMEVIFYACASRKGTFRALERNILVRNRPRTRAGRLVLRHALVEAIAATRGSRSAARAAAELAAASAFAASPEQNQVAGHNFGLVLFLTGCLVIPGAGLQPSLDVNLAALFEILARDFSEALPQHDVVPLGAVLPLASLVLESFVRGDRQLGHRRAAGRVLNFWILSQISNQLNPVQTLSCHGSAPSQAL